MKLITWDDLSLSDDTNEENIVIEAKLDLWEVIALLTKLGLIEEHLSASEKYNKFFHLLPTLGEVELNPILNTEPCP